jgi:hypothetical protein
MKGVTITVFPDRERLSPEFKSALGRAASLRRRRDSMTYKGVTFRLMHSNERSSTPLNFCVVLKGINAELPKVFSDGELSVGLVDLKCTAPGRLKATPGQYNGKDFGLPGARCVIDPDDELSPFHAEGTNYGNVVALFKRVMAGGLTPSLSIDQITI